jgi:hypothetical protein
LTNIAGRETLEISKEGFVSICMSERAWPHALQNCAPARWAVVIILAVLTATCARAAQLTVTSASDDVNGDVSNPAALQANPGPDGISFREAVYAANHASGPHTITFAPSLGPIHLRDPQIFIETNYTTIEGQTDAQGTPLTTFDGSAPATGLVVVASNVTVRHLAFVNKTVEPGYLLVGLHWLLPEGFLSPNKVDAVLIEENSFTGGPTATTASGVKVHVADHSTRNGLVSNLTIRNNQFVNMYGDTAAIYIGSDGIGTETTDVYITNNVFRHVGYALEIGCYGTSTAIRRLSFIGNDVGDVWAGVTAGFSAVNFLPNTIGAVEEDIVVANNIIANALYHAISFGAGNSDGTSIADHNTVQRVLIVDNLLLGRSDSPGGFGTAIFLNASDSHTTNGHIYTVRIINNTIAGFLSPCCALYANAAPATGSSIEDVILRNTILWNNHWDVWWISSSIAVDHSDFDPSKTSMSVGAPGGTSPPLTGIANILADPRFANAAQGDYHLTAASPAIDAGNSDGAPPYDLEGRPRYDIPATPNTGSGAIPYYDMGALEYGNGACGGFTDVDGASPFCSNVEWLKNRTITLGCTSTTQFCPADTVTRLTMAAFMNRQGTSLTSTTFWIQNVPGALDLDASPVVCQTTDVVATSYPLRAYLDSVLSGTSVGNVGFASVSVASLDGGATWLPITSAARRTTAPAGHWGGARDIATMDLAVGQTVRFGMEVSRDGLPGTGDLSDSRCVLRVGFGNRNGTTSPYDLH